MFPKAAKNYAQQFNVKSPFLTINKKITQHLSYLCKKIRTQELSKIAQSGHTERNSLFLVLSSVHISSHLSYFFLPSPPTVSFCIQWSPLSHLSLSDLLSKHWKAAAHACFDDDDDGDVDGVFCDNI